MSSYANAAAQGAEKLEHEKNVKSVENKAKEVAKDITSNAKALKDDVKKETSKLGDEIKKEYNEHKGPVIEFFQKISNDIKSTASYFFDLSKQGVAKAQTELQNPVVATHAVIGIGAVVGLITGIKERSRIFGGKTDLEITTILAALTGLVALDLYVFQSLYPKYDKKTLKK